MRLDLYKMADGGYTAIIDGRREAHWLCLDEALGVVACAIYCSQDERFVREITPGSEPVVGTVETGSIQWKLELFGERRKDSYTVVWGPLFAPELVQCEALGTVASVLFDRPIQWLKSYEAWAAWERSRDRSFSRWREPVAMLAGPRG